MKKFDGVHKYAYDSIFGIFNIESEKTNSGWFVLQQVSGTPIQLPSWSKLNLRHFQNRTLALKHLIDVEKTTKLKVVELLECV